MFEHFETDAIRIQTKRTGEKEHSTPLFLTSSFVFDDAEHARALFAEEVTGNQYTRFSNPNTTELIDKLCSLEHTEDGIATASGMSAVFTSVFGLVKAGDHIVSARAIFGSTHQIFANILPRFGVTTTYVDINKPELWEQAFQENTKIVYIETPSNPGLDIVDLEWVSALCKKKKVILIVDNCFCSPYIQRPADFGADVVIHSATKYLDGQGRVIAGVILGKKEYIQPIRYMARNTGPALSPMNAWIISKSLETLAVRMDRHSENAMKLAEFLEKSSDVELVRYPFLPNDPGYTIAKKQMKAGGGIVSFVIKGGVDRARKFLDSLKWFSLTANLGDTRTTVTHPTSTTHSKLSEAERLAVGILPGLIRVSVGLEHIDDIIAEVKQALANSK
ncbi:aminotransferase class I/II-fold pyridoxal phosphate-dependent enzyme [Leptospira sp. 2 VSF19]|uniref:O-succinylhomoserine sulfhydrylase n=1 Tax=Leptospira soteropolitanensis TaxID=2950025 RepID=A0AAW5VDU3_9LEPT|nr:aminotransferase class I/II-fold pyridoxal phosphate-dependent enzyme [Leptospira soteropolitanensis]MCW7493343.1 aminotransferase class I/II-fold pyridoxal phosphate-dependent enzyme [Leptospira soteropolitanensis]MCW7501125.1 aminotransferase class I/II-fold pyridoxal phosphate-dependent enzyme [Leptospira soteropolitanensis]MCW7523195.1 aminotransferase class I/II-fold pyridoxal phosphate-dependent enzyme [Leptospira soteropolitanensis]MCW7527056.1 aminotransferase class I/II-fold pyridox